MRLQKLLPVLLLGLSAAPSSSAAPPNKLFTDTSLDAELLRIGKSVEVFWKEASSISCTETIRQLKLTEKGKTVNQRESVHDYLVLMQLIGNELVIEESRELKSESKNKKKKRPQHRSLLITNGFSIMALVFHPHFQSSYLFHAMPDEVVAGRSLRRLDFQHIQGERSPSALQVEDRIYELAWKGSVWVDPASGIVVRMKTSLKEPLTEIGLTRIDSEIEYREISFEDGGKSQCLPVLAQIEAGTEHQSWRNIHEFSDYRRFTVETEVTIGDPDEK